MSVEVAQMGMFIQCWRDSSLQQAFPAVLYIQKYRPLSLLKLFFPRVSTFHFDESDFHFISFQLYYEPLTCNCCFYWSKARPFQYG